jgi:putative membrane protein insertion efficiency factor
MKYLLMVLIRLYQMTFSKALPSSCRFYPSCSNYGYEAVVKHGAVKGGWLTIKRLSRCQPFHPGGYDPVP